jgi:Phage integrase, N-terminal SAM-like domain
MAAAKVSSSLVPVQPVFTDAERLALAGYLAGYRGLTREAYTLDLRQFTGWCRARSQPLFSVRRADIETFARELEARGRACATVTRRLSTIAGFYKYAVEGRPAPTRRPVGHGAASLISTASAPGCKRAQAEINAAATNPVQALGSGVSGDPDRRDRGEGAVRPGR